MSEQNKTSQSSENETFFTFIRNKSFRIETAKKVLEMKKRRTFETQTEVSKMIGIPRSKIIQVENGTCKDINAIIDYIAYFDLKIND